MKEYWSGLLCPTLGDLSDPGIEPTSLTSPALAGRFFTTSANWESHNYPVRLVTQSCLTLCNPWTVACQAPLLEEFSRQEY